MTEDLGDSCELGERPQLDLLTQALGESDLDLGQYPAEDDEPEKQNNEVVTLY